LEFRRVLFRSRNAGGKAESEPAPFAIDFTSVYLQRRWTSLQPRPEVFYVAPLLKEHMNNQDHLCRAFICIKKSVCRNCNSGHKDVVFQEAEQGIFLARGNIGSCQLRRLRNSEGIKECLESIVDIACRVNDASRLLRSKKQDVELSCQIHRFAHEGHTHEIADHPS